MKFQRLNENFMLILHTTTVADDYTINHLNADVHVQEQHTQKYKKLLQLMIFHLFCFQQ